ncbi:cytochrome b/b6 domain-containing protein [Halobellus rufus]|uniref:cytochrome b/b6 domain-containing protein n=1 Tax=Halobellus rufus TaxID=1448860 RepID=UPI0006797D81|nr:cytochrome b/b6 domain-containing protein [Halobellus rufus]
MPFGIDIFRYAQRAGREVIVGLSWDILLVFAFIGTLTFLVHYVLRELWNPTDHTSRPDDPSKSEVEQSLEEQGVDEIKRFSLAQRVSHWVMAISIFALMLSGFVIMNTEVTLRAVPGLSWLDVHIVSAVVLIGYVVFHVGHVAYKGTWSKMWFGVADAKDLWRRFTNLIGQTDEYPRQFEYPSAQKLLHWGVTGASLAVIVTGVVLVRRVSLEPLWGPTREFSFLGLQFGLGTADAPGLIAWSFVFHDFFAVALLALVMGHVYFALRPNEWAITKSMITGRVAVEEYAEKYSPTSWQVGGSKATDGGDLGDDDAER